MPNRYNHLLISDNNYCQSLNESENTYLRLTDNKPVKLQRGGLLFCQEGNMELVIDMKHYIVEKENLITALPFSVIQHISHSSDFKGFILDIDADFFGNFNMPDKSSYFLKIKENPCIKIYENERKKILSLYDMLLKGKEDINHTFRKEIDENIIEIISYEVAAIYKNRQPIIEQPCSRNEQIFQQFIFSLFNNYMKERSVEYYAAEQSVTARHLSSVVKKVSADSAGNWIATCVILNIKMMLNDKNLQISEISDKFNFPNPSFFSQYFKKYAGMTPRQYRDSKTVSKM